MRDRFRAWLIRRLGVIECGSFGGYWHEGGETVQRWCRKPFGHSDSCAYDLFPNVPISQPGFQIRARFRGWDL